MKSKKEDINIKDLFREKLEYAEVVPNPALKTKLMRRVAREEFMNFNPGRFNIFYLGGILVAVFVASALIFSGKSTDTIVKTSDALIINKSDTINYIKVSAEQPLKSGISAKQNQSVIKSTSNEPEVAEKEPATMKVSEENAGPENINFSFSNKDIFGDRNSGGRTLKSRASGVDNAIFPVAFSGCAPLRVQFRNNTDSYDSCIWTFGDGGFSNKKEPEWIYDVEGEYKVGLEVFTNGRTFTSSATVNVYPRPKAHFEFFPENAIIPNDNIRFLNYSVNAERFNWNFGDGSSSESFEPNHSYQKSGSYDVHLVVFSAQGCSDTLIISNAFSASEYFIDFPNAFIPNEQGPSGGNFSSKTDEVAQIFHPSCSGVSEYQLKIFSKLGKLIFESYDINSGWDGYYKGQLCEPGVYIWKVRGKFRNGEPFIRMGDVTLLKI